MLDSLGDPLIVDWLPEQRVDLEVAMREGVAVVALDSKGLRLFKNCRINGTYRFIGVNRKEQVIRLASAEEVQANLPTNALGIVGKLGAELGQSQVLDIGIVMVGKRKTIWASARSQDFEGECTGATHFVRGATIGAFAMQEWKQGAR